ncbi:hypothetical protein EIP91_001760 [Steccherinum ochraceum]|uniref:Uncharacterized protein n=1 Tax=Steccherinum ochraceum TaxID=92696 RepID=A0A4R0RQL2_9APHY|nr:hypothetical protein EIP91_001760 [Steccherinum ochraceum]
MLSIHAFLLFTWGLLATQASPIASDVNLGTIVNLRIEGAEKTIFEGPIFTRGHNVTTVSGGTHHCDGTNNNENPHPGPTCTSALADAAHREGFAFDGTFDPEFDDFFITSIADSTETTTAFWGILLDFEFTPVGGCQQEVRFGGNVLWAFDAFTKAHFLKLVGPATVHSGQPAQFTVTDGMTGDGIGGARVVASGRGVGPQTSDTNGVATFTFQTKGIHNLKADKDDSIRSNGVSILVV